MTILEAAAQLRTKKISSVELVRDALDRIARLNPRLNAFITILPERALAEAHQADKELGVKTDRGPLHGIPVAVKDVFYTEGIRTTGGSRLYDQYKPHYDAAVVEKLRNAGAVIVGKTNMHELAFGITSDNPHYGTVHNPWGLDRIPGGSSGGSASAVAAGLVLVATGNDTGGSIRIPGSFTGLVGLKPTYGRVSRHGILPLDFSLDHAGPLTRTVRDAALALNVLAGYDQRDHTSSRHPIEDYLPPSDVAIQGWRVGWDEKRNSERVDAEVISAVKRMLELAQSLGATVVPIQLPDQAAINAVHRVILHSEVTALMEPHLGRRDMFSPTLLSLLQTGCFLSAADYVNAQRLRQVIVGEFHQIFEQVDCLLAPTTPTPAPRIGQNMVSFGDETEDTRLATTRLVRTANLTGFPALSLPCGFSSEGLPIGLEITCRPFEEALLLRIGAALEDATQFHKRTPALV